MLAAGATGLFNRDAQAGRPTDYETAICSPDGIPVCYYPTGIDDQKRCTGVRIDDNEAATGVVMYEVYDPFWSTTEYLCDGEKYCAWGYRKVGASVTKFFCAWTDDDITEDWLIGTSSDDILSFHYEQGNYEFTLTDDGCIDGLVGRQFGAEGDDVLHGSWMSMSVQYADDLHGDDESDTIYLHNGNDESTGLHDAADGGNHADAIWGSPAIDLIQAGGGADLVVTLGGADIGYLGSGDDVASTGTGDDEVWAGGGHDTVCTEDGGDVAWGEDDDDTLHMGPPDAGTNFARCGPGADKYYNADYQANCETNLGDEEEPEACPPDPDEEGGDTHADDF